MRWLIFSIVIIPLGLFAIIVNTPLVWFILCSFINIFIVYLGYTAIRDRRTSWWGGSDITGKDAVNREKALICVAILLEILIILKILGYL